MSDPGPKRGQNLHVVGRIVGSGRSLPPFRPYVWRGRDERARAAEIEAELEAIRAKIRTKLESEEDAILQAISPANGLSYSR